MYEESDKYRLCIAANIHTIKICKVRFFFIPPRLGRPNNLIYELRLLMGYFITGPHFLNFA